MNKNSTIIVLIGLILLGVIVYFMTKITETPNTTPTPVVTETPGTIPTPSQATAPTAITHSSVSPSDTTAIVSGTVNPKGALTNYWFEYSTVSNSFTNKTGSQAIGSGFSSLQAPGYITNLTKNTTYYFRLVVENQFGRENGIQYTFKTTEGNPAPVGSAPTTKTNSASSISRTTTTVNGEVTPNKSATYYWFEYGKTRGLGNTSILSSVGDGNVKVSVSASLSDLEPLTTYYFRINAQNQFGTINGSILDFKTTGPTSATAPKVETKDATGISSADATLHGLISANGTETKYWFEYSTDSLLGSVLLRTTPTETLGANSNNSSVKADVSNLASKTTYYFRLVGQNSQGTVRGDNTTFKTK
ncbi:MAG: hypothetical protein WAV09_01205 [Minisyncoccia bacterium]